MRKADAWPGLLAVQLHRGCVHRVTAPDCFACMLLDANDMGRRFTLAMHVALGLHGSHAEQNRKVK